MLYKNTFLITELKPSGFTSFLNQDIQVNSYIENSKLKGLKVGDIVEVEYMFTTTYYIYAIKLLADTESKTDFYRVDDINNTIDGKTVKIICRKFVDGELHLNDFIVSKSIFEDTELNDLIQISWTECNTLNVITSLEEVDRVDLTKVVL